MTKFNRLKRKLRERGLDLDQIADNNGFPIEPRIMPLVAALNYRGYETAGSCEGHSLAEWEERLRPKIETGKARIWERGEDFITYEFDDEFGQGKLTYNEAPLGKSKFKERSS